MDSNLPAQLKTGFGICIAVAVLSACNGSGSDTPAIEGTRSGQSFLYVFPDNYYFGTKSVGSTTTTPVRIANRGADTYELTSLNIRGNLEDATDTDFHPEEFATDILDNIVLQPAESVAIGVSFKPITEQQKKANFVVNYNTIKEATDAANANEQSYYRGFDQEKEGEYLAARKTYSDYLVGESETSNKRRAAIKLPIIDESSVYGTGNDLNLYLKALDQRDSGEHDAALDTLEQFRQQHTNSYLADDALYLTGYVQLIDLKDLPAAMRSMQTLREQYPDSTYYDTSLYSEAIAQLEIGNDVMAAEILTELRNRHTGLSAFGIAFAKDNLVSRLWFDRSSQTLRSLSTI